MNKTIGTATRAVALAAAFALTAAACGGTDAGDEQSSAEGGTLYILRNQDFEHLDPARVYVTDAFDFDTRLLVRSLTQYEAKPGNAGLEIAPDLAKGLGKPSDNATTWTFHLKKGIKYEDGSTVTAQDVKYGVERSFAPQLPEGPPWARQLLKGGDDYDGPYKDDGGLDSIGTPDKHTIVFHLKRPVPDFNYTTTFVMFGAVPEEKDKGVKYDSRPFSSGPYKIKSYERDKQLVLVRNKYYKPKTDPVREAHPDKIVVKMGIDGAVVDQRMLADQGKDQQAIMLGDITGSSIPRIKSDPRIKKRVVQDVTGCTRYLALNTSNEPLDDVKVRKAINYATSQVAYRNARGGPFIGEVTKTILPPSTKGYQKYDLYPNNNGKGDPKKAKKLLAEAGYSDGIQLTLTATAQEGAYGPDPATAIQQALAKADIDVKINTVSNSVYYTEIGNVKRETDLVFYGWCPDWPSAATFIPPLYDGDSITPQGNNNVSQYDNPEVNKRIDEILKMTDPQQANEAWGELDKRIMRDAPIVPLMADNRTGLIGSKVTGAQPHRAFSGYIDLATVGVEQ